MKNVPFYNLIFVSIFEGVENLQHQYLYFVFFERTVKDHCHLTCQVGQA